MIGLGASSFSYFGGVHYQNDARTDAYASSVRDGALPIYRARGLSVDERIVREFVLQLKWGRVDTAAFRRRFDIDLRDVFAEQLRGLEADGLLAAPAEGEDPEVVLTREGLLRVDELMPRFYLPEHREARYW